VEDGQKGVPKRMRGYHGDDDGVRGGRIAFV